MTVIAHLEHIRHRLDTLCEARRLGSLTIEDEVEYWRLTCIERDLIAARRPS